MTDKDALRIVRAALYEYWNTRRGACEMETRQAEWDVFVSAELAPSIQEFADNIRMRCDHG